MQPRAAYDLRFADGGAIQLGPRTCVMAVLNVTPDSFSDGGLHLRAERAIESARRMVEAGADLIDVGGESTRPGSEPVGAAEEADRVLPVIEGIRRLHDVRLSVDTTNAAVARQALEAGADLVNDVTALGDPEMLPLLVQRGAPVVLMHMRGDPRTMQRDTRYDDLTGEVASFLSRTVETAVAAGLSSDKIMIDPGIGFGKSVEGNLTILRRLPALARLGQPILIGASRKSFIGATLDLPVQDRLEGSLAIAACAAMQGAHVIRAHDVTATIRTVRMIDAIRGV